MIGGAGAKGCDYSRKASVCEGQILGGALAKFEL